MNFIRVIKNGVNVVFLSIFLYNLFLFVLWIVGFNDKICVLNMFEYDWDGNNVSGILMCW